MSVALVVGVDVSLSVALIVGDSVLLVLTVVGEGVGTAGVGAGVVAGTVTMVGAGVVDAVGSGGWMIVGADVPEELVPPLPPPVGVGLGLLPSAGAGIGMLPPGVLGLGATGLGAIGVGGTGADGKEGTAVTMSIWRM